jgi:hypothetical protein
MASDRGISPGLVEPALLEGMESLFFRGSPRSDVSGAGARAPLAK